MRLKKARVAMLQVVYEFGGSQLVDLVIQSIDSS